VFIEHGWTRTCNDEVGDEGFRLKWHEKRATTKVIVTKRKKRKKKLKKSCIPDRRDASQRGDDGFVRDRYYLVSSGSAEASEN
jgi:hypothetical protein